MELTTANQLMAFPALAVASFLEAESRQHCNRAFAFPETWANAYGEPWSHLVWRCDGTIFMTMWQTGGSV